MIILHLNLIKRWFDIIGDPKKEEYRALSRHWNNIFKDGKIKIKGNLYDPSQVVVCFSNGYATDRPSKWFRIESVTVGKGKTEWGAHPDLEYHVIKLGQKYGL